MSISEFIAKLNSAGIPIPVARDPNTGKGSITATTYVISSGLCAMCAVMALLSAMAKLTGLFTDFANAQQAIMNAFGLSFQFFLACGGFYVGRRIGRGAKGEVTVDEKASSDEPKT